MGAQLNLRSLGRFGPGNSGASDQQEQPGGDEIETSQGNQQAILLPAKKLAGDTHHK